MKIAIMQPYLFPYIGYFQLVNAVDVFVFYDDVNYINKGWINRNRILAGGKDLLFTVPCKDASQNKLIKDVELLDDPKSMKKLLSTIKMSYSRAPQFDKVYPVVENILLNPRATISDLAIASVRDICSYLGMEKTFRVSSELYANRELKKGDRLIDICKIEGITDYVNAAGGKELYTKEYFGAQGINLSFLQTGNIRYEQFRSDFVPWLSMIDVLMFNTPEQTMAFLNDYQLV